MAVMRPALGHCLQSVFACAFGAGALVLAACRESIFTSTDPAIQLGSVTLWAGGEIVLTSPAFSGSDTLPLVFLDDDTAQARYVPPDTVFAVVPDSLGTRVLRVQFPAGLRVPVDIVRIAGGYVGWWEGPRAWGHPVQWPVRGGPRFAVSGETRLLLVDAATQTYEPYLPDSLSKSMCLKGPGWDVDGGLVLIGNPQSALQTCGALVAYRDPAAGIVTDSGPIGWWWQVARLGPGDWLMYGKSHESHWIRRTSGTPESTESWCAWQPYGLAVSSRGRAVPIAAGICQDGIPVYVHGVSGPDYYIPGFWHTQGAQFTDDGDTLFMTATSRDTAQGYVLAARLSQDGSVIRSARNRIWSDNLLLDPNGRWIYSVGTWGPNGPLVQVFDRASLRLLATMQPPPGVLSSAAATAAGLYYTPILDARTRTLYVVCLNSFGSTFATFPMEVFSFQLLD